MAASRRCFDKYPRASGALILTLVNSRTRPIAACVTAVTVVGGRARVWRILGLCHASLDNGSLKNVEPTANISRVPSGRRQLVSTWQADGRPGGPGTGEGGTGMGKGHNISLPFPIPLFLFPFRMTA